MGGRGDRRGIDKSGKNGYLCTLNHTDMNKFIELNPNEVVSFLEKMPEDFTREDMLHFICEKGIRMIDFMYPAEDGRVKTQSMNVMGQDMVITRSYNEQGAPAEDIINMGGMENKSPYSEYKYDDHGNWISRKGTVMGQEMTQTRTIEYYE